MSPKDEPGARPISEQLVAIRDRWHCKKHPFFDRLAEGSLEIKHLGYFLAQHFAVVDEIFRSLGVTFAKAPADVGRFIVENLAEEAGLLGIDGGDAHDHTDLILRFTRYCGMSDEEVRSVALLPTWYARAANFWWIAETEPAIVRIGVQATQESQLVGENAERVIPALTEKYGFSLDSPEIHFFVEHSTADVKHGNMMLGLVDKHVMTPEIATRLLELAEATCRLRWSSFNELYRVTHLGESVMEPPVS